MRTIYAANDAFPIAVAGSKRVQTFPSGLVLVVQDYIVPRGQESSFSSTFAVGQPLSVDSPAIDGLFIFPEPQWQDTGDGFTKITVSAYGRYTAGSSIERSTVKATYYYYAPGITEASALPALCDKVVVRYIVPYGSYPVLGTPSVGNLTVIPGPNFSTPLIPGPTVSIGLYLEGFSSVNFGQWVEVTASWQASASVTVV